MLGLRRRRGDRFTLLLLEEEDHYLEDHGAVLEAEPSFWSALGHTPYRRDGMRVKGRVRLSARCIFFEPDEEKVPVLRMPFSHALLQDADTRYTEGVDVTAGNSAGAAAGVGGWTAGDRKAVCLRVGHFAELYSDRPFKSHRGDWRVAFELLHSPVSSLVPLLARLCRIAGLPAPEADCETEELVRERVVTFALDTSWVDLDERVVAEFLVRRITPLVAAPGILALTNRRVLFQCAHSVDSEPLERWRVDKVHRVERKRYLLRHTALEICHRDGGGVQSATGPEGAGASSTGLSKASSSGAFVGAAASAAAALGEASCCGCGAQTPSLARTPSLVAGDADGEVGAGLAAAAAVSPLRTGRARGCALGTSRSVLFAFESFVDREAFANALHEQRRASGQDLSPCEDAAADDARELAAAQALWHEGALSNFDYLIALNSIAGRTVHDPNQYPIVPWVISTYTTEVLDLGDERSFRDLSKPMGALSPSRLAHCRERYRACAEAAAADGSAGAEPPFMYGTHYSSAGFVLYYLVRQAPELMLRLQNGKFDDPQRLFHSVAETWTGVTTSTTDVKELIPEFYAGDGAFLVNSLGLDLGRRASDERVDHVVLPPWAPTAAHFVQTCRAALESDHVSARLHLWIELVFGHKQTGQAAVDAYNVFHPCTYEGAIDLDAIADPYERKARELQVREFGQTPRQLFQRPHPRRAGASPRPGLRAPDGLRDGHIRADGGAGESRGDSDGATPVGHHSAAATCGGRAPGLLGRIAGAPWVGRTQQATQVVARQLLPRWISGGAASGASQGQPDAVAEGDRAAASAGQPREWGRPVAGALFRGWGIGSGDSGAGWGGLTGGLTPAMQGIGPRDAGAGDGDGAGRGCAEPPPPTRRLRQRCRLRAERSVRALACSQDAERLYAVDVSGRCSVFSLRKRALLYTQAVCDKGLASAADAAHGPDGAEAIWVGGNDGRLHCISGAAQSCAPLGRAVGGAPGGVLAQPPPDAVVEGGVGVHSLDAHSAPVCCLAACRPRHSSGGGGGGSVAGGGGCSPGHLVSGSWDKTVKHWQCEDGVLLKELGTLGEHDGRVSSVACGGDGSGLVVSGADDGSITLWDTRGGGCRNMAPAVGSVVGLAILDGGRHVLACCGGPPGETAWQPGGGAHCLRLLNAADGREVAAEALPCGAECMAVRGDEVVVGLTDGSLRLSRWWGTAEDVVETVRSDSYAPVVAIAAPDDGDSVCVAGADGSVFEYEWQPPV